MYPAEKFIKDYTDKFNALTQQGLDEDKARSLAIKESIKESRGK